MDAQSVVAGLLVAGCSGWVMWTFTPATLRACCRAVLGLRHTAAGAAQGGCAGCGGGCGSTVPAACRPQVVKIVRRPGA